MEVLRSRPLLALAALNGLVLTAGLYVVAGPVAAVGAAVATVATAAAVTHWLGGKHALADFIVDFGAAHGWERQRMYRLPTVTPFTRDGGPGRPVGLGDARHALVGPLSEDDDAEVVLTRTTVGRLGTAATVTRHPVSVFLVDLGSGPPWPRLVCDPVASVRTRHRLVELMDQRRLRIDGLDPEVWDVSVESEAGDDTIRGLLAPSFRDWLAGTSNGHWGWQIEGRHLCVWFRAFDDAPGLNAGLAITRHIVDQLRRADGRRRASGRPGRTADHRAPAHPAIVPTHLAEFARRAGLEYWPDAEPMREFPPFESWATRCTDILAGELDRGEPAALARFRSRMLVTGPPGQSPEFRDVDFWAAMTPIPGVEGRFPWVSCRDRRGRIVSIGGNDRWGVPAFTLEQEGEAFARRFEVRTSGTVADNRLRQLFSPAFLVWHTEGGPRPFAWHFENGWLGVIREGDQVPDEELERIWRAAARISRTLRKEVEESDPSRL